MTTPRRSPRSATIASSGRFGQWALIVAIVVALVIPPSLTQAVVPLPVPVAEPVRDAVRAPELPDAGPSERPALPAGGLFGRQGLQPQNAPALPSGFTLQAVFTGLTVPTDVQFSPDGRVFVAEKSGVIKVFDNLQASTPHVFADLRTQTYNFWDRGLLGLALHPQFPARPHVYALYSYDGTPSEPAPRWGRVNETDDDC
ncbi:MAG: PQQ-dependent sugar dehydrogenase, partial [Dehalococcoidia bacterium]|nr:PQQ-dependent sugar dehydrogenase [Dehalococcoidia bacterium]